MVEHLTKSSASAGARHRWTGGARMNGTLLRALESFLRVLIAGVVAVAPCHAGAQTLYPVKPIRLIVAFPPGGSTDAVGRILSQKLQETLGQPVIVENRPGGNGVIGAQELQRAAPDGHTLLLMTNTFAINAVVMKNLPFDPVSDFIPVSTLYGFELVLVGHPSVPANNLKELLALARSEPNKEIGRASCRERV